MSPQPARVTPTATSGTSSTPNASLLLKSEIKDELNTETVQQQDESDQELIKNYPVQPHVDHEKFIPNNEFTPDYVNLLQMVQSRIEKLVENPNQKDNLEGIFFTRFQ